MIVRDWLFTGGMTVAIAVLIAIAEIIRRKLAWPAAITRKFVHVTVGILTILAPIYLHSALPLIVVSITFAVLNLIMIQRGGFAGMHDERDSYGTVYFPLIYAVLVVICWPENKLVLLAAMCTMTFGDAAAAIIGERWPGKWSGKPLHDQKSVNGSTAMLLASTIALTVLLGYWEPPGHTISQLFFIALIVSVVATATELLSYRGSDNITVPAVTAMVVEFLIYSVDAELTRFALAILLGVAVALLSIKLEFLAISGAVAALLLAIAFLGFGGIIWTLPILMFYLPSSLLSRIGQQYKQKFSSVFEKSSRRDVGQVFANGSVPLACLFGAFFWPHPVWYWGYLVALAVATADTMATEIGTLSRRKPRLIISLRTVDPGTSGAISLTGIFGSILGGVFIAGSGLLVSPLPYSHLIWICILGLLGSFFDSLLGATVQAQYVCHRCNQQTEQQVHCSEPARLQRGKRWLDNDRVNLISILTITMISAAVFGMIST